MISAWWLLFIVPGAVILGAALLYISFIVTYSRMYW